MLVVSKGLAEYAVQMSLCGMIHIPSFMEIGVGIHAILRVYLRN
jgi:hypothetical protein